MEIGATVKSIAQSVPYLAPRRCTVLKSTQENHDCVTLEIELPPDYGAWKPGQFNMLYVFGHGEIPISICGGDKRNSTIQHTIKAVGSVSKSLTQKLPGETLWIRGPYGNAWPDVTNPDDDSDLVYIGGGIGLAPLRSSIIDAIKNKKKGKISIFFGTRTPQDILFQEDLSAWAADPRVSVYITVDRVKVETEPAWAGEIGVVTNLLHFLGDVTKRKHLALTCGPDVMMRFVANELMTMGISNESIYVSAERNMKCAIGMCGRCQWGPNFVCKDGPVYNWGKIRTLWTVKDF